MTEQEMEELLEIDRELKSHFALRPHMGESYTRIKAEARQEIIQNLITDGVLTHEQLNECLMEKIMFGDYRGDEEMWKIPHCGLLARPEPLERPEPLNGVAKSTKEALEYAGVNKFKTMADMRIDAIRIREETALKEQKTKERNIQGIEGAISRAMAGGKEEAIYVSLFDYKLEELCEHFRKLGFKAEVKVLHNREGFEIRIQIPQE